MELTWLGTAGFIVKGKGGEIAFDPFLSRGRGLPSPFSVKSFENTQAIFLGHGHFDHAFDVPRIAAGTDLKVFAPGLTGRLLRARGVPASRLVSASDHEVLHRPFRVRALRSAHVRFDAPLVWSTLRRCGWGRCLEMARLGLAYPQGLTQTYLFEVDGKKTLFISSAGCAREELQRYRELEIDCVLAPLQGRSDIQETAARQVAIIRPKIVIPHHHDDFFPPLSQSVPLEGFRDHLRFLGFRGEVIEVPLFGTAQV